VAPWNRGGANAFNGPTINSFAINTLNFQTSYSSSDVLTNFPVEATATNTIGFGLKVV
jgi:hypothetical protein